MKRSEPRKRNKEREDRTGGRERDAKRWRERELVQDVKPRERAGRMEGPGALEPALRWGARASTAGRRALQRAGQPRDRRGLRTTAQGGASEPDKGRRNRNRKPERGGRKES